MKVEVLGPSSMVMGFGVGTCPPPERSLGLATAVGGSQRSRNVCKVCKERRKKHWSPVSLLGEGQPGTVIVGNSHGDDAP